MRWTRIAFVLLVVAVAAGLLFAWSGFYSVAASRGHFFYVEWLLHFGMRQSVETHALRISEPDDLDDAGRQRLGAVHYDLWCAPCHGSPAGRGSAVTDGMLPPPPPLDDAARLWQPSELFWIIKNGIKYTGMPAWPELDRDDEVWSMVAFLRAMPTLDARAYRLMSRGEPGDGADIAGKNWLQPGIADLAAQCVRCHGGKDLAPVSDLVPVLNGQPQAFLADALQRYASGTRSSGIMRPIAAALHSRAISELAAFYAELPPTGRPAPRVAPPSEAAVLAEQGARAEGVPACLLCHGDGALDRYPRLAGQSRDYMIARLHHMRSITVASGDPLLAVMVPIAKRLTDAQVVALADYFASLEGPASAPEK